MDQIIISGLVVRELIGSKDWERAMPQDIHVDLILYGDLGEAAKSDDIRYTINYRTIAKKVLAHARTARWSTAAALAADLARLCLEEPRLQKVRVRVEMPGVLPFFRPMGIEIEREKGALG